MNEHDKQIRNAALDTVLSIVKPGDMPCDCIEKVNEFWMHQCRCRNDGDLTAAAQWCESQSLYEQIERLKTA